MKDAGLANDFTAFFLAFACDAAGNIESHSPGGFCSEWHFQ